ncbi:hypothetical protein NDU88_002999 [Pleurodeles waltl]|uniref:Uncharacterized protein n=1 Tax=Pleurodeles waltl TaxID=8319 RepID=A0AAV7M407_PLEWA|nr:hypothetical protein NDU88_002999 [Pleurodeles waltl]
MFLRLLVKQMPTYLQDTKAVLRLLVKMPFDSEKELLISLEVEALYTNILQEATIQVINELIDDLGRITHNHGYCMSHEELDWSPSSMSLSLSRGPADEARCLATRESAFFRSRLLFKPSGIASPSSIRERDQG